MKPSYSLTQSAILLLEQGDITTYRGGALVNAANEQMLGGGGVDGAIHAAAGAELKSYCYDVPEVRPGVRCPTGEARITKAGSLQVDYVVHTVGPVYRNAGDSSSYLNSAYTQSLGLANRHGIKHIAFPAVSCGVYGYPYRDAAEIAVEACLEHVGAINAITFYLFSEPVYAAWQTVCDSLLKKTQN